MLNVQRLRVFREVLARGSFSEAAEALEQIRRDYERYGKVVKDVGVVVD